MFLADFIYLDTKVMSSYNVYIRIYSTLWCLIIQIIIYNLYCMLYGFCLSTQRPRSGVKYILKKYINTYIVIYISSYLIQNKNIMYISFKQKCMYI